MKEYIERGARYIDANAIKYEEHTMCYGHGMNLTEKTVTKEEVDKIPTADVVEVTRCKDCYYREIAFDGEKYCELHSDGWGDDLHYVDDDGYCSCGVRKDK